MAQQHKRVQVFRARQEQKPQQESLGSWQDRLPEYLKQVIREGRQELARLQQEDPAAYERKMEALRSDYTPPCIDPDWDPAEMETSET